MSPARKYYWRYRGDILKKLSERRKERGEEYLDRARANGKRYREKLKKDVLEGYGGKNPQCACCGEDNPIFLTIDHIHEGGGKHRKEINKRGGIEFYCWLRRNGYPKGFQVLCFNCNCGRSLNNGICPHKEGLEL